MLRILQWLAAQDWLLRRLGGWIGPFNPFLPEHRRDPHTTWRRLREDQPIFWSRLFNAWVLTRYDDVLHVLRDRNFTADRSELVLFKVIQFLIRKNPELSNFLERNLLMLEGPEHRRLRGLVSKAFTPRRIEQLRPRLEQIAEELLDRVAENPEIELVSDFAHTFPVIAIAEMLGVPASDRALFRDWSAELVQILDPFQGHGGGAPIIRASKELDAYFRPLLEQRRLHPQEDLLSAMITAEQDGQKLDADDLVALSGLLLVAGHETTANLIGNAVIQLLRHPDERKRLQDDPSLLPAAVDEFLRFDGPIQLTDRRAIEDCEIAGQPVKKGQMVAVVLAAANRDPARFSDPDRLDVGRQDNAHLAFGQGSHFCIGSQLAKLETEIALGALLRRFPDFTGPLEPTGWRRSMVLRGPIALPLRLA